MCIEIHTQRDISAQICRHRSFSFQEWSQRYAETSEAAVPQFRRQDSRNRQNSFDDLTEPVQEMLYGLTDKYFEAGHALYKLMLHLGVCKGDSQACASNVLAHQVVHEWHTPFLDSLFDLRCDPGTQYEHRVIANKAKMIFTENFPRFLKHSGLKLEHAWN